MKPVIYYDGKICNTDVGVVFAGAQFMNLAFNHTIRFHDLHTRIMRKVKGLIWGRISSLQCRYLSSFYPFKYELFDVKGELELKVVISSHYSIRNTIMELYVEFVEVDGTGPSLTTVVANARNEV